MAFRSGRFLLSRTLWSTVVTSFLPWNMETGLLGLCMLAWHVPLGCFRLMCLGPSTVPDMSWMHTVCTEAEQDLGRGQVRAP